MERPLLLQTNYKEVTIIVLVSLLIAARSDGEIKNLKTEFYLRFHGKFFERCQKIGFKLYGGRPDWKYVSEEVFQETFLWALEKINTFRIDPQWSDKKCERMILYWMAETANYKYLNRWTEIKKERKLLEAYNRFLLSEEEDGEVGKRKDTSPTFDREKFKLCWAKLNPMTQEIIMYCMSNETIRENNSAHLPDEVIQALTKKYRVKPPAIRQAKLRGLREIKSCKI